MATSTENHLLLTLNLQCTTGAWAFETSTMTWRFANGGGTAGGRPGLTDGRINLNTFDVHDQVTSRSLTIGGKAGTVAQSWAGDTIPDTECVTENDIDFFLTKAGDFFNTLIAIFPSTYRLESVKLYAVGNHGTKDGVNVFTSPRGPNTWTPNTNWQATGTNMEIPEMAMAVSHYSVERSRFGRGRVYVGPLSGGLSQNADGLFPAANITTIGNAAKALQDSVRTRGTPGASATYAGIIWNRPGGRTNQTGFLGSVINKIRIGDEPDHQERRTKKRRETYTDFTVV